MIMLVVLLLCCFVGNSFETVTLTKNFDDFVCTGNVARITCVSDEGVLRWIELEDTDNSVLLNTQSSDSATAGAFNVVVDSIDGQVITSTATVTVAAGFLNGTFIDCLDSISASANKERATIYVPDMPGPPTAFSYTSVTHSSVTLSWSDPLISGGSDITTYNIEITEPAGMACPSDQCVLDPTVYFTTIDNLNFNTQYTFIITASSCGGVGTNSSLSLFLQAEAPGAPIDIDACIGLEDNGNQLNLRMSWQCPVINDDIVPPILNYLATVKPLSDNSVSTGMSVLADCRCSYSTTIQIDDNMDVLYSVIVSSNNTVGSTGRELFVYSSANISTDSTQISATSALIDISISWNECSGLLADIMVEYSAVGSSVLELSVKTELTLPTSRIFVPLSDLKPGTQYQYSVTLVSKGGVTLGAREQASFETTSGNEVITVTVCPTISQEQSRSTSSTNNGPRASSSAVEECPTMTPLIVVMCVLAVIAIVLFVLFLVALCQCIKSRHQRNKYCPDSPNSIVLTAPNGSNLPPNSVKTRTLTTNFNDSYGHVPDNNAHIPVTMSNGYVTSDRTYEEIRSSKSSVMQSSPVSDYDITNNRPPIPVPYAVPDTNPLKEDLYSDATDNHGRGVAIDSTSNVNNPAYGRSEREGSLTPENYLIVTESKK